MVVSSWELRTDDRVGDYELQKPAEQATCRRGKNNSPRRRDISI
jgi:hypothetical protein